MFLTYRIPGSLKFSWNFHGKKLLQTCCRSLFRNVKRLKYNFCFAVEKMFELGNTTKSRYLGVRVEAQANGKEVWINNTPTSDRQCSDWQRTLPDDEALTEFSHEDRIVPDTIRKLDTLLTYVHDSNMATAVKQQ